MKKKTESEHLGAMLPSSFVREVEAYIKEAEINKTRFIRYAGNYFMKKVSPKKIHTEMGKIYDD